MRVFAADVVGQIQSKVPNPYGDITNAQGGLGLLITNFLRFFFVVAGILVFVNFIIAGFEYISAAGNPKKLEQAWSRIWQSLLGLILMVGSFALAAVFGYLIFGNALFMLQPQIYTP
jgi:hypothetical protein